MNKPKSIRIFKSDFLEQFTHVHPSVPLLLWGPVVCFFYYLTFSGLTLNEWFLNQPSLIKTPISEVIVLSICGFLLMTLTEYCLHRFFFHFKAKTPRGKWFIYLMHGLHHDDPNDPTRLVMPPAPALIYFILFYYLFSATLGDRAALPFYGAFITGYLSYDYTHYYVHHFNPKNPIGIYLKKYHMKHHFDGEDAKWGVSSPLWDFVFRTVEVKK